MTSTPLWCWLKAMSLFAILVSSSPTLAQSPVQPNPMPCLLVYPRAAVILDHSGTPLPRNSDGDQERIAWSNCVGVQIKNGTATAMVPDGRGHLLEVFFGKGATIDALSLAPKGVRSPGMFKQVIDFLRELITPDKAPQGSRSGSGIPSRFLKNAFSGKLVIDAEGLRVPMATAELKNITSFLLIARDVPRRSVAGVSLVNHILVIGPQHVQPGGVYDWQADVKTDTGTEQYSGSFEIAEDVEHHAIEEQRQTWLAGVDKNEERYLIEMAAFYFAHDLKGNATIALAQWYSAPQRVR